MLLFQRQAPSQGPASKATKLQQRKAANVQVMMQSMEYSSSHRSAPVTLSDLPAELITHITHFLPARAAVDFAAINHSFHNLLNNHIWSFHIQNSPFQDGPLWWAVICRDNCDPITMTVATRAIFLGTDANAHVVNGMLEAKYDPSYTTPLLQALKPSHHRKDGGKINIEMVKLLLSSGADPCKATHVTDPQDVANPASPLELAVRANDPHVLELLLSAPACGYEDMEQAVALTRDLRSLRATSRGLTGRRLLEVAAGSADQEVMGVLLDAGALVVDENDEFVQDTPLWAAISAGNLACVKMLIDGGAEMFAFSELIGFGCWHAALDYISNNIEYDNESCQISNPEVLDVLRYLLKKCRRTVTPEDAFPDGKVRQTCIDFPEDRVYWYILSYRTGVLPIPAALELLFDAGLRASPEVMALALFDYSAINANNFPRNDPTSPTDYVRILTDNGANPNYSRTDDNMTSLMWAARNASTDTVKLLLAHGADIVARDAEGMGVLTHAVYSKVNSPEGRKSIDTVRALLEHHCEADGSPSREMRRQMVLKAEPGQAVEQFAVLLIAIREDKKDVAELLIHAGADVNVCDPLDKTTALHLTAMDEDMASLISLLVSKGADVEARDMLGSGALLVAARCGNSNIVESLIKAGARVDAVDFEGRTPLAYAIREGHANTCRALLQNGASYQKAMKCDKELLEFCRKKAVERDNYRKVLAIITELVAPASR